MREKKFPKILAVAYGVTGEPKLGEAENGVATRDKFVIVDPAGSAFSGGSGDLSGTEASGAIYLLEAKDGKTIENCRPTSNGNPVKEILAGDALWNNVYGLVQQSGLVAGVIHTVGLVYNKENEGDFKKTLVNSLKNVFIQYKNNTKDKDPKPGLRIPFISGGLFGGDKIESEGGYHRVFAEALQEGYQAACESGQEIDFGEFGLQVCCYGVSEQAQFQAEWERVLPANVAASITSAKTVTVETATPSTSSPVEQEPTQIESGVLGENGVDIPIEIDSQFTTGLVQHSMFGFVENNISNKKFDRLFNDQSGIAFSRDGNNFFVAGAAEVSKVSGEHSIRFPDQFDNIFQAIKNSTKTNSKPIEILFPYYAHQHFMLGTIVFDPAKKTMECKMHNSQTQIDWADREDVQPLKKMLTEAAAKYGITPTFPKTTEHLQTYKNNCCAVETLGCFAGEIFYGDAYNREGVFGDGVDNFNPRKYQKSEVLREIPGVYTGYDELAERKRLVDFAQKSDSQSFVAQAELLDVGYASPNQIEAARRINIIGKKVRSFADKASGISTPRTQDQFHDNAQNLEQLLQEQQESEVRYRSLVQNFVDLFTRKTRDADRITPEYVDKIFKEVEAEVKNNFLQGFQAEDQPVIELDTNEKYLKGVFKAARREVAPFFATTTDQGLPSMDESENPAPAQQQVKIEMIPGADQAKEIDLDECLKTLLETKESFDKKIDDIIARIRVSKFNYLAIIPPHHSDKTENFNLNLPRIAERLFQLDDFIHHFSGLGESEKLNLIARFVKNHDLLKILFEKLKDTEGLRLAEDICHAYKDEKTIPEEVQKMIIKLLEGLTDEQIIQQREQFLSAALQTRSFDAFARFFDKIGDEHKAKSLEECLFCLYARHMSSVVWREEFAREPELVKFLKFKIKSLESVGKTLLIDGLYYFRDPEIAIFLIEKYQPEVALDDIGRVVLINTLLKTLANHEVEKGEDEKKFRNFLEEKILQLINKIGDKENLTSKLHLQATQLINSGSIKIIDKFNELGFSPSDLFDAAFEDSYFPLRSDKKLCAEIINHLSNKVENEKLLTKFKSKVWISNPLPQIEVFHLAGVIIRKGNKSDTQDVLTSFMKSKNDDKTTQKAKTFLTTCPEHRQAVIEFILSNDEDYKRYESFLDFEELKDQLKTAPAKALLSKFLGEQLKEYGDYSEPKKTLTIVKRLVGFGAEFTSEVIDVFFEARKGNLGRFYNDELRLEVNEKFIPILKEVCNLMGIGQTEYKYIETKLRDGKIPSVKKFIKERIKKDDPALPGTGSQPSGSLRQSETKEPESTTPSEVGAPMGVSQLTANPEGLHTQDNPSAAPIPDSISPYPVPAKQLKSNQSLLEARQNIDRFIGDSTVTIIEIDQTNIERLIKDIKYPGLNLHINKKEGLLRKVFGILGQENLNQSFKNSIENLIEDLVRGLENDTIIQLIDKAIEVKSRNALIYLANALSVCDEQEAKNRIEMFLDLMKKNPNFKALGEAAERVVNFNRNLIVSFDTLLDLAVAKGDYDIIFDNLRHYAAGVLEPDDKEKFFQDMLLKMLKRLKDNNIDTKTKISKDSINQLVKRLSSFIYDYTEPNKLSEDSPDNWLTILEMFRGLGVETQGTANTKLDLRGLGKFRNDGPLSIDSRRGGGQSESKITLESKNPLWNDGDDLDLDKKLTYLKTRISDQNNSFVARPELSIKTPQLGSLPKTPETTSQSQLAPKSSQAIPRAIWGCSHIEARADLNNQPSPGVSPEEPEAYKFLNTVLLNPPKEKTVDWFFNVGGNPRGLNFKVTKDLYDDKDGVLNTLKNVIIIAAKKNNVDKDELEEMTRYVKKNGGFNSTANPDGTHYTDRSALGKYFMAQRTGMDLEEIKIKVKKWKKFSQEVQDQNRLVGIFTGREGEFGGLRLGFVLPLVGNEVDLKRDIGDVQNELQPKLDFMGDISQNQTYGGR